MRIWTTPASLDGINFGIVSATHGPLNGGLSSTPLVLDTTTFKLTGVANDLAGLDASQLINTVRFQYGTSFAEKTLVGVPQLPSGKIPKPASIALLGIGLLAFGASRRNRKA